MKAITDILANKLWVLTLCQVISEMCSVHLSYNIVEELEAWRVYPTSPISHSKTEQSWPSNPSILDSDSLEGKRALSGFLNARGTQQRDYLLCLESWRKKSLRAKLFQAKEGMKWSGRGFVCGQLGTHSRSQGWDQTGGFSRSWPKRKIFLFAEIIFSYNQARVRTSLKCLLVNNNYVSNYILTIWLLPKTASLLRAGTSCPVHCCFLASNTVPAISPWEISAGKMWHSHS